MKKFLTKLRKWYDKPIGNTKYAYCKFYLQATTFSFEIHDGRQPRYTKTSLVYESDVYYDLNKKQILKDIKKAAKKYTSKEHIINKIN